MFHAHNHGTGLVKFTETAQILKKKIKPESLTTYFIETSRYKETKYLALTRCLEVYLVRVDIWQSLCRNTCEMDRMSLAWHKEMKHPLFMD